MRRYVYDTMRAIEGTRGITRDRVRRLVRAARSPEELRAIYCRWWLEFDCYLETADYVDWDEVYRATR